MVDGTFITGTAEQSWIKPGEVSTGDEVLPSAIVEHVSEQQEDSEEEAFSSDGEGQEQTTYFHVEEAEPPTNYDDPYSTLPPKIKLGTIKVSYYFLTLTFNLTTERYHLLRHVPLRRQGCSRRIRETD